MTKGNSLYTLRTEHQRAGKTDVKKLGADTNEYLEANDPTENELDILAEIWGFVAENIEREEWKTYTREDWEELERNYVERATFTEPDLFDDILTKYERGLFTVDEARAYAKRYRKCRYRFCENVFKYRRKNQYYCTSSDCRKREANAKIRFKNTGTYLPPHVYKENRDDTDQRNYKNKEITFNLAEAGNEDHEENAESVAARIHGNYRKKVFGGKRNREQEYIEEEVAYKYGDKHTQETIEESPVIRHWIHVKSEGKKSVI